MVRLPITIEFGLAKPAPTYQDSISKVRVTGSNFSQLFQGVERGAKLVRQIFPIRKYADIVRKGWDCMANANWLLSNLSKHHEEQLHREMIN